MSYGIVTVHAIQWVQDNPAMTGEYVTLAIAGQEPITFHKSNWPDVVIEETT